MKIAKVPMRWIEVMALVAAASMSQVGCATTPTESDAGPYPTRYREIAQDHLRTSLLDPYSARDFQIAAPKVGRILIEGTLRLESGWMVCYRGNAKNRMGAYTGAKDSVMLIKDDRVIASNGDPNHYEVRTNCKDAKFESLSLR